MKHGMCQRRRFRKVLKLLYFGEKARGGPREAPYAVPLRALGHQYDTNALVVSEIWHFGEGKGLFGPPQGVRSVLCTTRHRRAVTAAESSRRHPSIVIDSVGRGMKKGV